MARYANGCSRFNEAGCRGSKNAYAPYSKFRVGVAILLIMER
jgi:cytidine deaminase